MGRSLGVAALAAISALIVGAGPVAASTITKRSTLLAPASYPLLGEDVTLEVAQFDSNFFGSLNSITVALLDAYSGSAETSFDRVAPTEYFTVDYDVRAKLTDADNLVDIVNHASKEANGQTCGLDCISGPGSSSTVTLNVSGEGTLVGQDVLTNPSDFAEFIGSGQTPFDVHLETSLQGSGAADVGAQVVVVYSYTPAAAVAEPGTWLLMTVGFGLLGGATRWTRRAARFDARAAVV